MHVSIPQTTDTLGVKFSHFSSLSLGDGRLFPDNMPDDNPYKTSDTSGAMVITVIKVFLYHRVHLRCTERPLDTPVEAVKMNIIII